MSGPDCAACGEYFMDCQCENARLNKVKLSFESQLFFLRYATEEEASILIPIFAKIHTRLYEKEADTNLRRAPERRSRIKAQKQDS